MVLKAGGEVMEKRRPAAKAKSACNRAAANC